MLVFDSNIRWSRKGIDEILLDDERRVTQVCSCEVGGCGWLEYVRMTQRRYTSKLQLDYRPNDVHGSYKPVFIGPRFIEVGF